MKAPLFGLVLAGGKSKRMGFDKSSIEYHGKPQTDHARELLEQFCERVCVSGKDLLDQGESAGPISGLRAAFRLHPSAAWLVLACDLPGVEETTLRLLISKRRGEATVFGDPVEPEPLCGIYEPALRDRIDLLQSPKAVLLAADCEFVAPSQPDWLTNVNTPRDLADWMASRKSASDFAL